MAPSGSFLRTCSRFSFVVIAFLSALILGAIKGVIVGPIAASILIAGNVSVILGMFPVHVVWTIYTLVKTCLFDPPLKVALLLALPALSSIWLGLSIAGSVLVGVGYGFFTPWVSTFEAFRRESALEKLHHSLVDGTWGTIKGSCTVVSDFADICYHSYPSYLNELRDSCATNEHQTLRFVNIPGFIAAGIVGLVVDIPLFTAIAIVKSPYMLFKGWYRLAHDLISREGPFLETACIPIAGLAILLWPIVVVGSVLLTVFSSFFIGLYSAVVVYQEKSFRRGVAFAVAMVAEFDEYTNDGLYLKEGTFLPKPRFRRNKQQSDAHASAEPSTMLPSMARSRSVREVIQEVKMVQVWGGIMKACEIRGKELLDIGALNLADLKEFLKAKNTTESSVVSVGLPSYSLLHTILHSIKTGSEGFILIDGVEITHLNRPNDILIEWFFQPLLVLKDQIRVIRLAGGEEKFLQKFVLYGNDKERMNAWDNSAGVPQEALRSAQIQGISRRLIGMVRSVSKFPTYRRKYRHVVKALIAYQEEKEGASRTSSSRSVANVEKEGSVRSSSWRSAGNVDKSGSVRSSSVRSVGNTEGSAPSVAGIDSV